MGHLQPLNIFLRQEIDRMQKVISIVRSTLKDLKLAIDGTIIMSENLRDALDNMFDARIPNSWKRVRLKFSPFATPFKSLCNTFHVHDVLMHTFLCLVSHLLCPCSKTFVSFSTLYISLCQHFIGSYVTPIMSLRTFQ